MTFRQEYKRWLESDLIDTATKLRLKELDEKEIEDCFYKSLEFGTGGLRGLIGDGNNRMNLYTVRRATQGLSNYLLESNAVDGDKSVAIAYDSRIMSKEFALEAALTLCENGIKAYLFEDIRTTPELSFTVRHLKCVAGIVITASHNPKTYNGYKVYGADGGQITLDAANAIIGRIHEVDLLKCTQSLTSQEAIEKGLLNYIGSEIDSEYVNRVKGLALADGPKNISVMYTPLHGTGLMPIKRCLDELGYTNIQVLESQAVADGNFPTVKSPNPEEAEALKLAIEKAKELDADIVLGTDPDCDRVGVAIHAKDGSYRLLNGNQIGALLIGYLLSSGRIISKQSAVVKTIVTSELGAEIARGHGLTVFDTLTGFKYIGEKIAEFEMQGTHEFLFGYEESYGYLAGTFVRDKDAVIASLLIIEMAAFYKSQNLSLEEVLNKIYNQYGFYLESLKTITLPGLDGLKRINETMQQFKDTARILEQFPNLVTIEDYEKQMSFDVKTGLNKPIELPKSDVLKFKLSDESWFAVRPSGTEPKIKFYMSVLGSSEEDSANKLKELTEKLEQLC